MVGRESATELALEALEHLEGRPADADLERLAAYAARHDEGVPVRDALLAVLLDASGTLTEDVAARALDAIRRVNDGGAAQPLQTDPDLSNVPRRQALAERLLAERARRLRPRMHAVVAAILAGRPEGDAVPSWFLERNWVDLRDALVQRVRNEPMHREAIARWFGRQPPVVADRMRAIEETLVDVVTQAILHTPERAPLAPYCGEQRIVDTIRTAVAFRGEPQRARLARYLARLAPGTPWYATVRALTTGPANRRPR